MKIKTRINTAEAEAQLDAFFESITAVAAVRAVNVLRDQAEVAGLRAGAEAYHVRQADLQPYISAKLATSGSLEASIVVKGRPFPLSLFNPRKTARGIVVTIKGKAILIAHSFQVPTRFGAHLFSRGRYAGGTFFPSKPRLPITERLTFSAADVFKADETIAAMDARVAEQIDKVFAQEIKRAARTR